MGKSRILDEILVMKQRMDSLYSKSFEQNEPSEPALEAPVENWRPLVDVWETDEEWFLMADLPGVLEEELKIEIQEKRVTISGTRDTVSMEQEGVISRMERPWGAFSRTFTLPPQTIEDQIVAEVKQGVLTLKAPKKRRSARRITVSAK